MSGHTCSAWSSHECQGYPGNNNSFLLGGHDTVMPEANRLTIHVIMAVVEAGPQLLRDAKTALGLPRPVALSSAIETVPVPDTTLYKPRRHVQGRRCVVFPGSKELLSAQRTMSGQRVSERIAKQRYSNVRLRV